MLRYNWKTVLDRIMLLHGLSIGYINLERRNNRGPRYLWGTVAESLR